MKQISRLKAAVISIFVCLFIIACFSIYIFKADKVNVVVLNDAQFNFSDNLDFYECTQNFKDNIIRCNVTNGNNVREMILEPNLPRTIPSELLN